MPKRPHSKAAGACLALLIGCLAPASAQENCRDQDIQRPAPPAMIETNLQLLRGDAGQRPLPEWSKIEKLRNLYRSHAEEQTPCTIARGEDIAVGLFVSRDSVGADADDASRFLAKRALQFYGLSRLKVERADQDVTREYAFPITGPAPIAEVVAEDRLETLIEDLAQLQLVSVPRLLHRQGEVNGEPEDCFLVSHVTVVPSRVFDEPEPTDGSDPTEIRLTLSARRTALETVVRQTNWLQRMEKEEPGCRAGETPGLLARQVTSLNLTIGELVPDLDFVAQSLRFWREVERRIEKIRAEEESWKKEIAAQSP